MATPNVVAIIVAAGASRRMGFDKLSAPLAGRPLLAHTLLAFEQCIHISRIVLVCTPSREDEFRHIARRYGVSKLVTFVSGGKERQDSVWNGLLAAEKSAKYLAVHDGARPLVTPLLIANCVRTAQRCGGACAAEPLTDTVHWADREKLLVKSIERKGAWRVQTPQVVLRNSLLDAYFQLMREGWSTTDEASILVRLGKRVVIEESMEWNFKVTVPQDLVLAEAVLAYRQGRSLEWKRRL
ncbi:MAG: 2-C-methyl-D-erythritol 4-phosphate cytidylyltransferase [Candidatus Xiphinematobacter sp.]|nr:MAG: 2-C-methyl-D-erythritol 4-phosphate cytidylyltransferase [Candidatus Xiphinematobacter sp.]QQY09265.1 MAG: 2-C-methyl-D-erythritol 4-phosphate cytidylyltransferase [Candidatus Xiphinematobacter sp.]QQY10748.1 MAG: 2-C-methyl-D-erythritol 4-phosphate cytidylyltransferase [Candidatus Xiphinematobacter sp.]QQY11495.1 MAG: 2-C-methyl-D-erythritol 4-phosphate cytidylyltransferase [Candidatus Xiphinematobacter sp.]